VRRDASWQTPPNCQVGRRTAKASGQGLTALSFHSLLRGNHGSVTDSAKKISDVFSSESKSSPGTGLIPQPKAVRSRWSALASGGVAASHWRQRVGTMGGIPKAAGGGQSRIKKSSTQKLHAVEQGRRARRRKE